MRTTAILLVLCASLAYAAEGGAPAPAPGADTKAQGKELEMKLKAIRDQVLKDDAELGKLKTEADDARKRFETATEAKLKDNADYQALKAQLAELKGKKDGEKKKDK
jgi:hypothetical protein